MNSIKEENVMQAEDDGAYVRIKQTGWNLSIMKEVVWTDCVNCEITQGDLPVLFRPGELPRRLFQQSKDSIDCMVPKPWYWRLIKK